jgi:tetratricopeptide (TPR) repeat protein
MLLNQKKIFLFLAATILALSACAALPPGPPADRETSSALQPAPEQSLTYFALSQMRLQQGDRAGALADLDLAAELDKNNAYLSLERARMAVSVDDLDKALGHLHEALTVNPALNEAWVLLGGVESTRKNYLQAIKAYSEALRLDPGLDEILLVLGILYLDNHQPQLALKPLQTLQRRQPELPLVNFYLGQAYSATRHYQAAEKAYLQAASSDSVATMAKFELAKLYELQNRLSGAEEIYEQLLEAGPSSASALARERLGLLYMRQGRNESALRQFAILKGLNPQDAEVRIRLGLVLYEQGKYAQSAEEFRQILDKEPGHRRALYYLGVCLAAQAKYAEALRTFAQITPGPDRLFEDSALQQAQILVRDKKTGQALALLQEALSQRPRSIELIMGLSLVEEIRNNYGEAFALLDQAAQIEPGNAEIYYRMASLALRRQDRAQSMNYLRRTIEADPTHGRALNDLGYSLLEEPDPDLNEAESLLRRALKEEPERTTVLDSIGWLFYLKGQYEDAYQYLRRAADNGDIQDPVIFEHLGDTCAKLERTQEAVRAYQHCLALQPEHREAIQAKIRALRRQ